MWTTFQKRYPGVRELVQEGAEETPNTLFLTQHFEQLILGVRSVEGYVGTFPRSYIDPSGAPNENIVQNHLLKHSIVKLILVFKR